MTRLVVQEVTEHTPIDITFSLIYKGVEVGGLHIAIYPETQRHRDTETESHRFSQLSHTKRCPSLGEFFLFVYSKYYLTATLRCKVKSDAYLQEYNNNMVSGNEIMLAIRRFVIPLANITCPNLWMGTLP